MMKTRKAAKKRVRVTKKGKVKMSKSGRGHLLSHKSRKRKRSLRNKTVLTKKEASKIRKMV